MNNSQLPGDPSLPTTSAALQQLVQAAAGDFKYSVEDFFKRPEKTSFSISPDGTHLAWLGPWERRLNLFVQSIGSSEARQLTQVTSRDIQGFFWANAATLVFIQDAGGDENYHLFSVDIHGSPAMDLTPYDGVRVEVLDDLSDDDDFVIISMNKNNPQLFEPYRLQLSTGNLEQLAIQDDPANAISSWITDHEGRIRLATRVVDGVNSQLLYRAQENEPWSVVLTTHFKESVSPLFFHFDNPRFLYVNSNLNRDKSVIVTLDLHTGEEVGEVLFEHPEVDAGGLSYSRKRKVITLASYVTDRRHLHFFDEERARLQQTLEAALPGYEVILSSADKSEQRFIIRTYSDRSLGAFYYYDKNSSTAPELLCEVSPWIEEQDLAPMQPVSYASKDGWTIHGYLTLPKNSEGKRVPVVINPHGGPWVRDAWGYNPEVQLLASRGYAVLKMNYRGSTGYGKAFWEAGFKQWGRKMQDDITDGVAWLIREGIADPDKIAIYGGSYGGYATLAGVTFTPDLYTCAIDYVGVSNLLSFLSTIPPYWKPYLEMMYEMVGHPENEKEAMMAASPVFHAEKIKTPLLVIQGANDPRVNIDESDQIVRTLRSRGVEVPYLVKYDEGHGFRNEENQFEVYKVMLGFLKLHLGQS